MNILVAEDDPVIRKRLRHFLEKWGHWVLPAENGLEALEKFLSEPVDIVILDWTTPKMDGLELIGHIRGEVSDKPFVYIILLTARGEKTDLIRALTLGGVDDYMVKPFDPGDSTPASVWVNEWSDWKESFGNTATISNRLCAARRSRYDKPKEETIIRLLTALESRDEETGGHVRRIALLSSALGKSSLPGRPGLLGGRSAACRTHA